MRRSGVRLPSAPPEPARDMLYREISFRLCSTRKHRTSRTRTMGQMWGQQLLHIFRVLPCSTPWSTSGDGCRQVLGSAKHANTRDIAGELKGLGKARIRPSRRGLSSINCSGGWRCRKLDLSIRVVHLSAPPVKLLYIVFLVGKYRSGCGLHNEERPWPLKIKKSSTSSSTWCRRS